MTVLSDDELINLYIANCGNESGYKDVAKSLRAVADAAVKADRGEPVAAQHRFRHLEKNMPDWSVWQPCKIDRSRLSRYVDSQGYQVEYRELYSR